MKKSWIYVLQLLLIICFQADAEISQPARSGELLFGWASVNITPERPVALDGMFHTRISSGVNDELTATALAIEARDEQGQIDQAVIVSCDMVGIRRMITEKVRKLVQKKLPELDVNKIVIAATHTHTAPVQSDAEEAAALQPFDFMAYWIYQMPKDRKDVMRPGEYVAFLAERLSDIVVKAWEGRKPGGMSFALSHAVIANNRRAVYANGQARMYGSTNDRNFEQIEGASDHSVDVVFFWREGKQLEGVAINIYCPAQVAGNVSYISANYWHEARELLRKKYNQDLYILPLTGAAGDQAPFLLLDKKAEAEMLKRRKLTHREEVGRRILKAVDDVAEVGREDIRTKMPFQHRVERVALPVRQLSEARYAKELAVYEAGKDKTDELELRDYNKWQLSRILKERFEYQKKDPFYYAEIHTLRLGDLAVATDPFELFTDYGFRIKGRSPAVQTMVVQLAVDCMGYLPTQRAVQAGGYSAREIEGLIGPKGGTVLVDETVKALKGLWGQ